jgi:hypothetical protein
VREITEPIILVGHSGDRLLLPVIADSAVPPVAELVFVDSGGAGQDGRDSVFARAVPRRAPGLAVGGMLPPWSEWWGEEAMRDLLPDETLSARPSLCCGDAGNRARLLGAIQAVLGWR